MKKKLLVLLSFATLTLATAITASAATPKYEYKFNGSLDGATTVVREGDNEEGGNAGIYPVSGDVNVTYDTGVEGDAIFLDGTYGLELDAKDVGDTYSLSFWVKPDRFSNYGPIIQIGSDLLSENTSAKWLNITKTDWDGDSAPVIWSRNETLDSWPWYCTAYFSCSGGYMIEKKEWSHIVVTVDGSKVAVDPATGEEVPGTWQSNLYVNGELIGTGPAAQDVFNADAKVFVGINCWDILFKGYFDDIKIYDTVLTAEEVAADAGASVSPSVNATGIDVTPVYKYDFEDSLGGAVTVTREGDNEEGGNAGVYPTQNDSIAVTYEEGVNGKAISLDGTYGLELDAKGVGDTYSLAFWINPARFSNYGPFIQLGSDFLSAETSAKWLNITKTDWDGDSAPVIWSRNETLDSWPWYCTAYFSCGGGYSIEKNAWSHIVVTVDGSTVGVDPATGEEVPGTWQSNLYVNGALIGTGPVAQDTFNENSKVFVGINCWDIIFKGLFDDIEIYDTVLTADQVAALAGVTATSAETTPEATPEVTEEATPTPTEEVKPEPTEEVVETTAEAEDESGVNPVVVVVIVVAAVVIVAGAVVIVRKKKSEKK